MIVIAVNCFATEPMLETVAGESELRKAVRAPAFGADPVVNEEEPRWVASPLHTQQPRVIAPPVGALPIPLKVIALGQISSAAAGYGSQLIHAATNQCARRSRRLNVRLVAAHAGVTAARVGDDRQREGTENSGVHGRVARRIQSLARRTSQPLIKMKLDRRVARAGEQRTCESFSRFIFQERLR